ncbi:copper homeostasis protein CutC [Spiroplasma sp. DGKH1]|uniref:copper homeostasis protein CutC n=1 Tax=Spiroplasma sp. DGKH1 TaxID=3050074 RepID=UPI0034C6B289
MFLEVIATSVDDVKVINQAQNVSRIELCAALEHGGYTPNYDVIKESCAISKIPIRVITRHQDADFYYHPEEFEQIKKDIEYIKTTQADGIVVGIITPNQEVDLPHMQELVALANPLKVTFHRAFDEIIDKQKAIQELHQLNIRTVLTQGGLTKIIDNLAVFDQLRGYGVEIQAGSGVNLDNYQTISKHCDAIHIGSAVRVDQSWAKKIDLNKLLQIK